MTAPDRPLYSSRRLERRRVGAHIMSSREFATTDDQIFRDQLQHRLEAYVLTERLAADEQRVTFEVPASWWQHWRASRRRRTRWSRWWLRRRPIRYTVHERWVSIERSRMWPEADLVTQLGGPTYVDVVSYDGPARWKL